MPVTISDEVLMAAHISEPELKQEIALTLFHQERLTLAQASRVAEMGQLAFQALLADTSDFDPTDQTNSVRTFELSAKRNALIVVSDTSPVLNLARIGRLELLPSLYHQVFIPSAACSGTDGL